MGDLPKLPNIRSCKCPPGPHQRECLEPDNRLENWERSQKEFSRLQAYLSLKTNRQPNQLLVNTLEDHRALQHFRNLMGWLVVPCYLDKYRGNPAWWKLAPMLYKKGCEPQNYFFQLTKLQKNELPELEYVQVPGISPPRSLHTHMHRKEKNMKCTPGRLRRCDSYCLKKLNSCVLNKIQPHIPDIQDVRIVGRAIYPNEDMPKEEDIFEHFFDLSSMDYIEGEHPGEPPSVQPEVLLINNEVIRERSRGTIQIAVLFTADDSDSSIGMIQTTYVVMENKSKNALRVYFTEIVKAKRFNTTAIDDSSKKFYFNRNYLIIQPDEKLNIPFWFKSSQVGIFELVLKLNLIPDPWNGKLKILIKIKATTIEEDCFAMVHSYENMIQNRVKQRLIKTCLEDMISKVPKKAAAIKVFAYDRANIFEAMNSTYDPIHNRSKYIYDKEIVDELEDFYNNVRLDHHPEIWTLRLDDLRIVTKDREAYDAKNLLTQDYENILSVIEKNKRARSQMRLDLEKVWARKDLVLGPGGNAATSVGFKGSAPASPKGDKGANVKKERESARGSLKGQKSQQIKSAKTIIITEPIRAPLQQTLYRHLENIIVKLKSPATSKNYYSDKLHVCYNLLCAYIDKTVDEIITMTIDFNYNNYNYLNSNRSKIKEPEPNVNPTTDQYQTNEVFTSCGPDYPSFTETVTPKGTQPQPPWSQEIPLDNYDKRFQAFQKEDKTLSPTAKKDKSLWIKKAKQSSKNLKVKDDEVEEQVSEEETFEFVYSLADPEEETTMDVKINDCYVNNIYVLFYNNLCKFIEDFEEAVHELPNPEVHFDTLRNIKDMPIDHIPESPYFHVECINVKQKISEVLKSYKDGENQVLKNLDIPEEKASNVSVLISDILKAYVYPKTEESEPEETIVSDRQMQTSVCSDITVAFDEIKPENVQKTGVCVCPKLGVEVCDKAVNIDYNFICQGQEPEKQEESNSNSDKDN